MALVINAAAAIHTYVNIIERDRILSTLYV